ncbi:MULTISPECIES: class I SAM-dependent methyltransferase [unclassified Streptomyces]|uniref:class I SAM-dependent DNA methyltransferase n=1 Tax=unclassified Streptomyces TaxID=2593676 RepID=UPI000DB9585C|nr:MULTISPECIES: class I SAM-dependent methyltransferase [unclassified Streptomyces]MYT71391.1 methyltransferase domain-containing protein [Streptomyces sp. SID8367]RAJ82851.1 methyltransferase family protein [Streptomyces sp. PsTaAH-137]
MSLAESWDRYAVGGTPRRTVNARGEVTWFNWTQYADHGPNEGLLGPVAGRRVLELGSGNGSNLAHLVTLGAIGVGVDVAPAREAVARERWGHLSGLELRTAEAAAFLTETADTFDVVLSVFGAVWFVDPATLLPLIRSRMAPGGILAFSHLPPGVRTPEPGKAGMRHDHTPDEWTVLLAAHGFSDASAVIVDPPEGKSVGTMLAHAAAV